MKKTIKQYGATYEVSAKSGQDIILDGWKLGSTLRSMDSADVAYLTDTYGPETVPQFVVNLPTVPGVAVWMNVEITGRTVQHVSGRGPCVRVRVTLLDDPSTFLGDGTKLDTHGEVVDAAPETASGWMALEHGVNMVEVF